VPAPKCPALGFLAQLVTQYRAKPPMARPCSYRCTSSQGIPSGNYPKFALGVVPGPVNTDRQPGRLAGDSPALSRTRGLAATFAAGRPAGPPRCGQRPSHGPHTRGGYRRCRRYRRGMRLAVAPPAARRGPCQALCSPLARAARPLPAPPRRSNAPRRCTGTSTARRLRTSRPSSPETTFQEIYP